jgi:hypothetical protein
MHIFNHKKIGQKMWAIFLIFKNLPKVNNHPLGENSPNLVTLTMTTISSRRQRAAFIKGARQ